MKDRPVGVPSRRRVMGIGMCALALMVCLGCTAGSPRPQEVLNKLMTAASKDDQAGLEAYIARGSILDTKGFLETGESLSTDELTRRIKLRALTEVFLARIETYSVESEREIDANTMELVVAAAVKDPEGPAEKIKCQFRFVRQSGQWKLADWQGVEEQGDGQQS